MESRNKSMVPDLKLLEKLMPDTQVLIWTHNGPLSLTTPGIASMDYLLDGLVIGHIRAAELPLHHVVFAHPQFGRPFWVVFVDISQVAATVVATIKGLLPKGQELKATVYTAAPLEAGWETTLKGSFKSLEVLKHP